MKRSNVAPALKVLANSVSAHRLSNGLRILLMPNTKAPTCTCYTFYQVGSRDECFGKTGLTHFIEHLMFSAAAPYRGRSYTEAIESLGATGNGYTTSDLTMYCEGFMSESLETILDLEARRMRGLRVTERIVEREKLDVFAELSTGASPRQVCIDELAALSYAGTSYQWPVLGRVHDIANYSRADCEDHLRRFYGPNHATVCVAGAFEAKKALVLIRKYFRDITCERAPGSERAYGVALDQVGERRASISIQGEKPAVTLSWLGPPARHPDSQVLDLLQHALSLMPFNRLSAALEKKAQLVATSNVEWEWKLGAGRFLVALEVHGSVEPADAEAVLLEVLEGIAADGLTAREIELARASLELFVYHSLNTNNGRAFLLGNSELLLGHWSKCFELLSVYAAITSEQIRDVVRKYLQPQRRSVVTITGAS